MREAPRITYLVNTNGVATPQRARNWASNQLAAYVLVFAVRFWLQEGTVYYALLLHLALRRELSARALEALHGGADPEATSYCTNRPRATHQSKYVIPSDVGPA